MSTVVVTRNYNPSFALKKLSATRVDADTDSFQTAFSIHNQNATSSVLFDWTNNNNNRWTGRKSLTQTLGVVDDGSTATTTTNQDPWIVGHRGCIYQELENTREGFNRCADMGCNAVELDVFVLPKCGTVICFHGGGTDENPGQLLEYCGVDGNILDLSYQEALEQLVFAPTYAEFPCPASKTIRGQIPTLEQVLQDAKQSGLHVKLELKGSNTVEPTLEIVERLGVLEQCSFSSFDLERLAHLRQLRPDRNLYPTGALFNDQLEDVNNISWVLEQAQMAGATEIHLRYDTCTPQIIDQIHKAGFGSMAWFRGPIGMGNDCSVTKYGWESGCEDEAMYHLVLKTGVQQMCVNKPDALIGLRRKLLLLQYSLQESTNKMLQ